MYKGFSGSHAHIVYHKLIFQLICCIDHNIVLLHQFFQRRCIQKAGIRFHIHVGIQPVERLCGGIRLILSQARLLVQDLPL